MLILSAFENENQRPTGSRAPNTPPFTSCSGACARCKVARTSCSGACARCKVARTSCSGACARCKIARARCSGACARCTGTRARCTGTRAQRNRTPVRETWKGTSAATDELIINELHLKRVWNHLAEPPLPVPAPDPSASQLRILGWNRLGPHGDPLSTRAQAN